MGRLLCSFGRQSHASDAAVMASTSAASDIGFRFGVRSALFPLPLPQLIHSPQCATATRPSSLAKLNPNHRSEIVPAISFLSPCKMHHPSLCLAQYRNGDSGHALAAQCNVVGLSNTLNVPLTRISASAETLAPQRQLHI